MELELAAAARFLLCRQPRQQLEQDYSAKTMPFRLKTYSCKTMLKQSVTLMLLLCAGLLAQAQTGNLRSGSATFAMPPPPEPFSIERLLVGGSVGASLGNVIFVDVSPALAYRVTDLMRIGAGFTYRYINDRRFTIPYKQSVLGWRAFVQHDLFFGFFAHVEYENLTARFSEGGTPTFNGRFPTALLGGGYSMSVGDKSVAQIQVLYPVTLNPGFSLYSTPVDIRIGFLFGL